MSKSELIKLLDDLGWTRRDGQVNVHYYLSAGPVDRMIQISPTQEYHVLCETRGTGHVVASIADAAEWARAAMPHTA